MLFCCAASPPRIQTYSLPPFQPSSFPRRVRSSGERRSKKAKHRHLRPQSLPEKNQHLRTQGHPDDVYDPTAQDPDGNSPGSPDSEALASCLRSCGSTDYVRRVHAAAVRSPDGLGMFLANHLISLYLRIHEVSDARKVFEEMPERSVVSWMAMMNGYQKLGHCSEVVRLFLDMLVSGVQGNSLTFVCLLKSCGEQRSARLGRQVHCCVVKGGWSNVLPDSAVAHFYAQCGDVASASTMFDKMASRDVISWTTMITAYMQHGHGDKALQMFSAMVS